MIKKVIISASNKRATKLKVLAEKKERARRSLVVTAKNLAVTAKEKESIRRKLEVTAKKLAVTAKEKESIRRKLEVSAKNLAVTAKEKESIRRKLEVTAKKLAVTAKEKESIRRKLEVTAGKLAVTAKEKERVRRSLAVTAKNLAVTAKERENIRRKLEVTAEKLAVTAKEKERVRRSLAVTAKNLAVTAKERENIRRKLEVTAEKLAVTAKEKERVRRSLAVTAKNLAVTAKERENIRRKLEVTAEKLAVTALEIESANKYARSLIEASLDPLVTISPKGKITDVNMATIKVTGIVRNKLIGTDFSNYFTEPTKAQEVYRKVLKEGQVKDYPLTIKSREGKLIDVLYNLTVYKDEVGKVLGVFAAARDITESKALERTRDEFFAIASHELRTPLTAIRGNTELIIKFFGKELKDPEIADMLSDIHNASIRLISLINDFLDVSRLEQGKVEMKLEKIDMVEIAENTVRELKTVANNKKLKLELNSEHRKLLVLASNDRIKQVLINLISNAMNYTDKGGVTVKVIKIGSFVKVMVTDTGVGIISENQKRLFKKFSQAGKDVYARDVSKGTGLGLYISKLIIEKMGGQINLEKSEPGNGSTFSFTVPLVA